MLVSRVEGLVIANFKSAFAGFKPGLVGLSRVFLGFRRVISWVSGAYVVDLIETGSGFDLFFCFWVNLRTAGGQSCSRVDAVLLLVWTAKLFSTVTIIIFLIPV
jgi:hypothetical protein